MARVFLAALLALPLLVRAQSSFIPLNEDTYNLIDRYEVKAGHTLIPLFTSVKPYERLVAVAFMDTVRRLGLIQSKADHFNYEYIQNDSWEWSDSASNDSKHPILHTFYTKKSDLYSVHTSDFDLHVNPVLYLAAGSDSRLNDMIYVNTRGVEVRGMVDGKVGFYTYLTDNQARLSAYVQDFKNNYLVVPHEGFWKGFKTNGVDYLQARGYVTFNATRHIAVQFGNDSEFIGNGLRSLIRSDFSPPTLFLKGDVRVWKINYLFLVNKMTADVYGNADGLTGNGKYPAKYTALHHLSIDIGHKLNVGVFETVVFSGKDSLNSHRFELSYLNPIIFYRAVEQQFGSSDNVLLGTDFNWHVVPRVSMYGQFLLDEFVLSNIKAGNGWWANKFGIQAGLKYIDAFSVNNLDLQGEINIVRPYTFSHSSKYDSYSSYRQPLAHPLGANFYEMAGIMRYQPLPRLQLTGKLILAKIGRDGAGENWGSNVLKINTSHEKDFGNTIGQGHSDHIIFGSFVVSWLVRHNLFADAELTVRRSTCDLPAYDNSGSIASVALRWNIARRTYDF